MQRELIEKIKYLINKKKSLSQICEELELEDYEVIGIVELLKQDGTHCFQTSCLEDQTPYTRSLGLANDKSCWWLTVESDDKGNIYNVKSELECFGKKRVRR